MTDLSIRVMKYQENKESYKLGILSIYINFIYIITTLNHITPNYILGTFTLVEISLSLLTFLACSKVKVYSEKWSYYLIGFGGYQFLKILTFPIKALGEGEVSYFRTALILALISSGVAIYAGIVGVKKSRQLREYLIYEQEELEKEQAGNK